MTTQLESKLTIDQQIQLERQEKQAEEDVDRLRKENRQLTIELKDKERKLANPKHEEAQTKKINFLIDEVSGMKKLITANQ
jgi:hypothetical protein